MTNPPPAARYQAVGPSRARRGQTSFGARSQQICSLLRICTKVDLSPFPRNAENRGERTPTDTENGHPLVCLSLMHLPFLQLGRRPCCRCAPPDRGRVAYQSHRSHSQRRKWVSQLLPQLLPCPNGGSGCPSSCRQLLPIRSFTGERTDGHHGVRRRWDLDDDRAMIVGSAEGPAALGIDHQWQIFDRSVLLRGHHAQS